MVNDILVVHGCGFGYSGDVAYGDLDCTGQFNTDACADYWCSGIGRSSGGNEHEKGTGFSHIWDFNASKGGTAESGFGGGASIIETGEGEGFSSFSVVRFGFSIPTMLDEFFSYPDFEAFLFAGDYYTFSSAYLRAGMDAYIIINDYRYHQLRQKITQILS